MTGTNYAAYIREQTKTNSTTLSDARIVTLTNPIKDEMAGEVIKINEDYFGIFMYRNIVADQRNYAFPTDLLSQMKYIEAKLDGTEWEKLTEVEVQSKGIVTDETSIQSYFSSRKPSFEIFGGELIIYHGAAVINVTNGLKLWAIIYPADISTAMLAGTTDLSVAPSATSFGFPRQLHKLLADKVVITWKESQPKPIRLSREELLWPQRMQSAMEAISHMNLDRPHEATVPYNDGSDY